MFRSKLSFIYLVSIGCLLLSMHSSFAQKRNASIAAIKRQVFEVSDPDHKLSPFTGMTREHWKDAARYLLSGAFSYINKPGDPMKFPKQPGKSYPRNEGQVPTEMLEGLCRTLFMAAPLLREDPTLKLHGIKVADYYRHQLAELVNPESPTFVRPRAANGGPSQNLVEFGGLSLCLFVAPEVLWRPLSQRTRDDLAKLMLSYGDGPTIGSNWKFFNIFILSFFEQQGYTVNKTLLTEYLEKTLAHYRGNGWYNDAPAYDYYSMWAFQLYGPLWAHFFGRDHYPKYAQQFESNFSELKNSYPFLFGRQGDMIMWGRSMSYRFGSVAPFALMGLHQDAGVNYGWMRRIASGTLLQFLKDPELMRDSIPTLGFYGAFEPAVQPYSCRGSVFWMGKAFLGLLVPADSPFWTATENEGEWNKSIKKEQVKQTFLDSSKILITDYAGIGASEIRAWCNVKATNAREPFRSSENYNRLSYNNAFSWQADSVKGVVAMNYLFRTDSTDWEPLRLYTFKAYHNGIYYRDAVLESDERTKIDLADIALPNGILRVDRISANKPVQIRLGHYALPQLTTPIKISSRTVQGNAVQIIDNGQYQLAMVSLKGWSGLKTHRTRNVHPQAVNSAVSNAADSLTPGSGKKVYMTLMLWERSGHVWTDKELLPVQKVNVSKDGSKVKMILSGRKNIAVSFN